MKGSPEIPVGGTIIVDDMKDAEVATVRGYVKNREGRAVSGAVIDIWQTAPNRLYAVADKGQSEFNLPGRLRAQHDGYYEFITIKPVSCSVPIDGPAGSLITMSKGHGMRAAHIHLAVSAPGHKLPVTQICPSGDPYLESDAAFSIADPLVVDFRPNDDHLRAKLIANFDFILKMA